MKPTGAGSVMASRAPLVVEGDNARMALYRALEFFPTPPWAARAGGELIQRLDPGDWTGWEPSCGMGHMVHGMLDYFRSIHRTDIHNYGWDGLDHVLNFLADERLAPWPMPTVDWIFTNPAFKSAADFARLGYQRARRGVALLCRLSFFESIGRYPLFYGDMQLTAVVPFFERVPMELGGWDPDGSTATAYAWFVWIRPEHIRPELLAVQQLGFPVAPAIPPGTKARLTHPDDARLFARPRDLPLLDQGA